MNGTPYGLILLVAAGVLATRYARLDRPSPRSKKIVAGITTVAALVYLNSSDWFLVAAMLLLGVCIYVVFYRMVDEELRRLESLDSIDNLPRPARDSHLGNGNGR